MSSSMLSGAVRRRRGVLHGSVLPLPGVLLLLLWTSGISSGLSLLKKQKSGASEGGSRTRVGSGRAESATTKSGHESRHERTRRDQYGHFRIREGFQCVRLRYEDTSSFRSRLQEFVDRKEPVVLTGDVLKEFIRAGSVRNWSNSVLHKKAGDAIVEVKHSRLKGEPLGTRAERKGNFKMRFADFLSGIEEPGKNLYMGIQHGSGYENWYDIEPLRRLKEDINYPGLFAQLLKMKTRTTKTGEVRIPKDSYKVNLWMGNAPRPTKCGFHFDDYDNVYTVLAGEKEFTLASPDAVLAFEKAPHVRQLDWEGFARTDHQAGGIQTTNADPDMPDYENFPGLKNVGLGKCRVSAGEVFYMPHNFYHQVSLHGRVMALNFWAPLHAKQAYANQANSQLQRQTEERSAPFAAFLSGQAVTFADVSHSSGCDPQKPPCFFVLGTQKSGTSSLFETLMKHSMFERSASGKELRFFDMHLPHLQAEGEARTHHEIEKAYRKQFSVPMASDVFSGDASPGYLLFGSRVARQIKKIAPTTKQIVILRDPVRRAMSQYNMILEREGRRAHQTMLDPDGNFLSFDQAIRQELDELEACGMREKIPVEEFQECVQDKVPQSSPVIQLVTRGLYALQLESWYQTFPKEQLRLVCMEDELIGDPDGTAFSILDFLGLPQEDLTQTIRTVHNKGEYKAEFDESTVDRLREFYSPQNARLKALTGKDCGWT